MKLKPEEMVRLLETFGKAGATRIVIVKHIGNGNICMFEVPNAAPTLHKGDEVLCDTRKGEAKAVCITDTVVCGKVALDAFAALTGATMPLKKVIGRYELVRFAEEN